MRRAGWQSVGLILIGLGGLTLLLGFLAKMLWGYTFTGTPIAFLGFLIGFVILLGARFL